MACTKCFGEGRVRSVACDHEGCYGDCGRTIECSKCGGTGDIEPDKLMALIEQIIEEAQNDTVRNGYNSIENLTIRARAFEKVQAIIRKGKIV